MRRLLESYFFIITAFFNIYGFSYETYPPDYQKRNSLSITPPRIIRDSYNVTVYLGYANNPFGQSMPVLPKKQFNKNEKPSVSPSHNQIQLKESDAANPGYHRLNPQEQRSKRGVVHLYNMVSCATGCNPLIYKGYGCYCGFLGSGYAVDGIDRCCKLHDWCYDKANCPMFLEYFVPYFWKCWRDTPLCAVSQEQWGHPRTCAFKLCECDRVLSECLRKYPCPSTRAICKSSPCRYCHFGLSLQLPLDMRKEKKDFEVTFQLESFNELASEEHLTSAYTDKPSTSASTRLTEEYPKISLLNVIFSILGAIVGLTTSILGIYFMYDKIANTQSKLKNNNKM